MYFFRFQHQKSSVIYTKNADVSTADISKTQQLTPKQSYKFIYEQQVQHLEFISIIFF